MNFLSGIIGPLSLAAGSSYFWFGNFILPPELNAGLMIAASLLLAFYAGMRKEAR